MLAPALLSVLLLTAAAPADPAPALACPHVDGFIDGPFVADAATAKAIYQLTERRLHVVSDLKHFTVVRVDDEGGYWSVFRTSPPPPPDRDGQVTVTAGGGQLELHIDKCSGAISHAHYGR